MSSTEFVSSGSYIVHSRRNAKLTALLGTCVGVAVYDRENGVGGLFHILLPEPTSDSSPWGMTTYASTGMPLFLKELLDSGAKRENLKAIIAGGALVGQLSMGDLEMDIGGRTAEIVKKFLAANKIPVISSETGGYFSCKLTLDSENWDYTISPIGHTNDPEIFSFVRISPLKVDLIISSLKPVPQVALKIIRTIHSGDYDMKEIAEEARQDQVISAKIINICNSAKYSPLQKIDSVDQALVMVGEKDILQIVVSSAMEIFYGEYDRGYSLCKGGLFHHARSAAIVAEMLALHKTKISPDVAYTAALLHDIGKVILDQYVSNMYPYFYRRVHQEQKSLVEVEKEVLGIDHTQTGKRLAELLELPDDLAEAIANHHHPERSEIYPELTHVVYVADLLVSRFQAGYELDRLDTDKLASRMDKIGFNIDEFPHIVEMIPWKSLGIMDVDDY
ncbi:MAG: HDOD domain-containing protein [Candidatus Electryonea clarkiae]|nr:HDOD domain-containing protein [Candidatus Electryonea clarkiae]MDP8289251.1 HDOD domain-containing protein [Candidatus Electryonea clarkiae]